MKTILSKQSLRNAGLCALIIISTCITPIVASPKAGSATIYGKVLDKKTGETLIGVSILIKGTARGATTDLDGKYRLTNLDPGSYSVEISYVSYAPKTVNEIKLNDGANYQLDVALAQSAQELNAVEVTAQANRQATSTLLMAIKNSTAIADGISQDVIKRTPDKNTGEVLKRVSGTSVQDNKFVIVRGLNDRYNYTLINGMPFSSTEPDRKAVSFDIFPAPLIDNIIISKTATPDLPGEFAGGIIQINTRDIPEENSYSLSVGGGMNSQTTNKKFYHGEQGGTDWLGEDDGTRSLPALGISPDSIRNLDIDQRVALSKKFNNDWKIYEKDKAAPSYSLQGTAIKNFKFLGAETGMLAGLTYSNSRKLKEIERQQFLGLSDTGAAAGEFRYDDLQYTTNVLIGGLLNFSMKLNGNNKLTLKNTWTRNSDDYTMLREGKRIKENSVVEANVIGYTQSQVLASQLQGEHYFEKPKIKFTWGLSASSMHHDEPDLRKMSYSNNPSSDDTTTLYAALPFTPSPTYAGKVYTQLEEQVYNEKGDITVPLSFLSFMKGKQEFKAGTLQQQKFRDYRARDFGYKIANPVKYDYSNLLLPQDSLFMPGMISDSGLVIDDITNPYDKYTADVHLSCFYAMMDNAILKNVRLIWGMRYEDFHQRLFTRDANGKKFTIDRDEPDWLPSANLIWSATEKMNVRLSASQTVARPEFREIAHLSVYDFITESTFEGNDSLVRCKIDNYDVRFEFYPVAGQMFSVGGFYKKFKDPIEQVVRFYGNRSYSFQNVNGATNYGVEFEFRVKPAVLLKANENSIFNSFTVFSNLAFIHSKVDVGNIISVSDSVRPLQGQSPYVLNAGVQFIDEKTGIGITGVFNQVGDRIDRVGDYNYFNIIESKRELVDLQFSKLFFKKAEIRFTVNDLMNKKSIFYWDVNENNRYDEGTDQYIEKRKYGVGYSVSFSYKF